MEYKGFRELHCYKEARKLRVFVSEIVRKFPDHEKFLLKAQILASSRSCGANMAEGYGRFTYAETRHFFIISRGSLTETLEHLTVAYDEKYISAEEFYAGEKQCELVFRMVNGYIAPK